ncbi:MAG: hypothetical protein ETSY1_28820 [Candidatus Entotheonella factor]|uniref:SnoaL-like domain-containing protein n=1 Tax=Entotheonella factor TaxID=1429438 RepID=W4LCR9_ENTF1|nr:nuclear transport factor 2 family protein [Candidatus Entotheonella palauensis]ETW95868.1 MAG: hypothetical protein ETSY1_28820 [Candidatus Entotheonella factor]
MQNAMAEDGIGKWFEYLCGEEEALIADLFEDGFVYHTSEGDLDLAGVKARIGEYRAAFPELLFHIDFVVSQGDRVGVAWTAVTKTQISKGVGVGTYINGKFTEFSGIMPNL